DCPGAGIVLERWPAQLSKPELSSIRRLINCTEAERKERFEAIKKVRERISFETTLQPFLAYLAERSPISPFVSR
ncbi:MAG: hypothetical protein ACUVSU_16940, partial [Aggregatilineaceae bacterium]